MIRLENHPKARNAEISALLKSNRHQANALGLERTPVFLVGLFNVDKALVYDEFKEVVADFVARIGK